MFDHSDFSWREFACEFIPLIGNWLRTTKIEVPALLAETASCDPIHKDIQMLLWSAQFNDIDEIIKYLRDHDIIKYLRDEICFDPVIYCNCGLIYPEKSMNFKRICWISKKIFLVTKKFFF